MAANDEEDVFAKYSTATAPSLRAFLLRPLTGKKHQLRVMLKSLRAPAMGDPLYATKDNFEMSASDRCYLHACGMRIAMPAAAGVQSAGDDVEESNSKGSIVQVSKQVIYCRSIIMHMCLHHSMLFLQSESLVICVIALLLVFHVIDGYNYHPVASLSSIVLLTSRPHVLLIV